MYNRKNNIDLKIQETVKKITSKKYIKIKHIKFQKQKYQQQYQKNDDFINNSNIVK